MKKIKRFFRELWRPSLKCERIGHKNKTWSIKIRKRGGGYRAVASDYTASVEACGRCGHRSEPRDLELLESWTGCQMPTAMWDKMDEQGYVQI